MQQAVLPVLFATVIFGFVAAPALIARVRNHPDRQLIYKLSPLTFFSFVLWGALIVWAASDQRDDAVISKYVAKLREGNRLPATVAALVVIGALGGVIVMLR